MTRKVTDIPTNLLILAKRYVGKDNYYATFNELIRDGIRMAILKAKRSGVERIGKEI